MTKILSYLLVIFFSAQTLADSFEVSLKNIEGFRIRQASGGEEHYLLPTQVDIINLGYDQSYKIEVSGLFNTSCANFKSLTLAAHTEENRIVIKTTFINIESDFCMMMLIPTQSAEGPATGNIKLQPNTKYSVETIDAENNKFQVGTLTTP